MHIKYLSLILLVALFFASVQTHAHGPIPIPLEGINKILEKQFPIKTNSIAEDISTFPSINDDIDTLNNKDRLMRSDAYKRLISRGNEVTPNIIQRISDPEVNLLEKKRLINLLGRIQTPGTDKDIIAFTEMLRGLDEKVRKLNLKTVYFQAFRSLARYNDTTAAIDYANTLLKDNNIDSIIHAQAIFFLADQNTQYAKEWFDIYNKKNISIDEQYALRYLSGKVGTKSDTIVTINFLLNLPKSKINYQYETRKILDNLKYTVEAEKLRTIISTIKKNNARFVTDRKINSYPLLSELYNSKDKQREKAALVLFSGWNKDKNAAIESLKYMISINNATPYIRLWKLHNPALIRIINHLGYTIDLKNNTAAFVKTPASYRYQTSAPDSFVQLILASFTNNDLDLFTSTLFINKQSFITANQDIKANEKIENLYSQLKSSAIDNWKAIYNKTLLNGVLWSNVKYKSYENSILVGINGTHISTIKIHLEANNKEHTLLLENCILFNNKWYVISGIKWK